MMLQRLWSQLLSYLTREHSRWSSSKLSPPKAKTSPRTTSTQRSTESRSDSENSGIMTDGPWEYFSYETDRMLACPHCGKKGMDPEAMLKFDAIRKKAGVPMTVTSGYRCPEYNDQVSSTGLDGPHTTGKALDIGCHGTEAMLILKAAMEVGAKGIGVQQKDNYGKRFLHIDFVDEPPRPWIWSY